MSALNDFAKMVHDELETRAGGYGPKDDRMGRVIVMCHDVNKDLKPDHGKPEREDAPVEETGARYEGDPVGAP